MPGVALPILNLNKMDEYICNLRKQQWEPLNTEISNYFKSIRNSRTKLLAAFFLLLANDEKEKIAEYKNYFELDKKITVLENEIISEGGRYLIQCNILRWKDRLAERKALRIINRKAKQSTK